MTRRLIMALALIAAVLAIYSMLPKPGAESIKAPECFDGTPEAHCPSWAFPGYDSSPRQIIGISETETTITVHYSNGPDDIVNKEMSKP